MPMNKNDRDFIRDAVGVITDRLDRLIHAVRYNSGLLKETNVSVEDLEQQVTALESRVSENTSVSESAIELLNEVAQLVRDNVQDPAALEALAARLSAAADATGATSSSLADAILANTDVDPTPPA